MSFELILPFLRPIESLLLDESVSEIMGNPDASWWYEREGIMLHEKTISLDAGKLQTGLEVIANQLGKKLDEDNPILHAQLPDGSRLAAVIPPVVRSTPALIIRKFTSRHYTVDDLIARGTLTRALADFLAGQIRSGKTTLLRILTDFIPQQDRLVIIEDTFELQIQTLNILPTERQTDTFRPKVTFDDPLKSALRRRQERIILGKVHANSAEKALHRFANLVTRSHSQSTFSDTQAEIAEAVDFVVHVDRQQAGAALSAKCSRFAAVTAARNASSLTPSSRCNLSELQHGVLHLLLSTCQPILCRKMLFHHTKENLHATA